MGRPTAKAPRTPVAQAVVNIRAQRCLTRADLAGVVGVDFEAIKRIETGQRGPTVTLLRLGALATGADKTVIVEELRRRLSGANEFLREVAGCR